MKSWPMKVPSSGLNTDPMSNLVPKPSFPKDRIFLKSREMLRRGNMVEYGSTSLIPISTPPSMPSLKEKDDTFSAFGDSLTSTSLIGSGTSMASAFSGAGGTSASSTTISVSSTGASSEVKREVIYASRSAL